MRRARDCHRGACSTLRHRTKRPGGGGARSGTVESSARLTSDLTVGRFNLYVLIQGVYGDNILNENKIEMENGTTTDNKFAYVANDSWTPGSNNNRLGSIVSTERRGLGVTSDLMEDGSFMRIKTVTLSYELPLPKLTSVFK